MTTEACSGRNPSACDDDSVSDPEHRQERSWHGVRCSGRALKRSELTGRRLAACRHDCNTSGGDEGCKSEAPHRLAPSSDIKGIMTYTCKSVRLRLQVRGMGQCSGMVREERGRKRMTPERSLLTVGLVLAILVL
jgi:hypothetical protein